MSNRGAGIVLLLVLASGGPAFAGQGVGGIGILGDSYSDEYQFYPPHRASARNWVEILAASRGLDFGEFRAETRDEPRNQGFAYNWARSAATSDDMIASGQHTGLAGQVASGRVRLAVVFIGGNDFIQALHSGSPVEQLQGRGEHAAANVRLAVETLLAASSEVKILLTTVPDLADLPEFREKIRAGVLNRAILEKAAVELETFNTRIRALVSSRGRVAIFDFARLCRASTLIYPRQVQIAGRKIDRAQVGNDLDCMFLADVRHLGTMGQGILAKAIVAMLNVRFDAGIAPLEDREILAIATSLARPESGKEVATTPP